MTTHYILEFDCPKEFDDSKEHYAIQFIRLIADENNIFNIKLTVDNWEDVKNSRYCYCESCNTNLLLIEKKSLESIAHHYMNLNKPNPYVSQLEAVNQKLKEELTK